VGNPVLVAGIGTGFEATLQYRIHDGHDERTRAFSCEFESGGIPKACEC
jgi:hypothetical protein